MKNITWFILFCLGIAPAYGQINLVRNPSFEDYHICPSNVILEYFANDAYYWSSHVDTSYSMDSTFAYGGSSGDMIDTSGFICIPLYCNSCDTVTAPLEPWACAIPNNAWFYHYPRTGNGLMWVNMYGYATISDPRGVFGYLQGRLYHNLVAGKKYCVNFYVVNTNFLSTVGCNHIAAYFDDGSIDTNHMSAPVLNQLYHR
jgi:hypothetical protein